MKKPMLIGECNPYGGDDEFALYPAPDGCSGHRLCCLILGMSRKSYMESFDRANLCSGKWSLPAARKRAEEIISGGQRLVLCGSKVSAAFGLTFVPFARVNSNYIIPRLGISSVHTEAIILPHPSGRNLLWNEPGIFEKARTAVVAFAPELAGVINRKDSRCTSSSSS